MVHPLLYFFNTETSKYINMFVDKSAEVDKVLPALVKAKGAIGKVAKGANNPFFKSKYADLPAILDVVEPALAENDLAMFQPISGGYVITTFIHKSGQFVSFEGQELVAAKQHDPQAMGSAITYARRYSLSSVLSINADKDDDGNAASAYARTNPAPAPPAKVKLTDSAMKSMIETCATAEGKAKVKSVLGRYSMTAAQSKKVNAAING